MALANQWITMGGMRYNTMKEGRTAGKLLEGKQWIGNRKKPGDGKTCSIYKCNSHEDCGRLIRVFKSGSEEEGGQFIVQLMGEHTTKIKEFKRKNSALTFAQETQLVEAIDMGVQPGQFRVGLTSQKHRELAAAGENWMNHKKPGGGLEGVPTSRILANTIVFSRIRPYSSRICLGFAPYFPGPLPDPSPCPEPDCIPCVCSVSDPYSRSYSLRIRDASYSTGT
jgi:hypothetical protein